SAVAVSVDQLELAAAVVVGQLGLRQGRCDPGSCGDRACEGGSHEGGLDGTSLVLIPQKTSFRWFVLFSRHANILNEGQRLPLTSRQPDNVAGLNTLFPRGMGVLQADCDRTVSNMCDI